MKLPGEIALTFESRALYERYMEVRADLKAGLCTFVQPHIRVWVKVANGSQLENTSP